MLQGIMLQNWNYAAELEIPTWNYAAAKFLKKVMLQCWNYAAISKFSVEISIEI